MKLKDFLTLKVGAGVLISGTRYNPLINYSWSTTTTGGLRYLKDVGSTSTYNASMYFGRGAYFNGVDQGITNIPYTLQSQKLSLLLNVVTISAAANQYIYKVGLLNPLIWRNGSLIRVYISGVNHNVYDAGTATSLGSIAVTVDEGILKFYLNGVLKYTAPCGSIGTTGTVKFAYDGAPSSYANTTIKDAYAFNKVLTQTEITQAYEQPEAFYAMAQTDSTCVLNMPMCETSSTVRNYKTGIDYAITNYTTSVRNNAKNLQYGLQTCKFVRDGLGVIQSASDYLECDGVGYANTGYLPIQNSIFTIDICLASYSLKQFGIGIGYNKVRIVILNNNVYIQANQANGGILVQEKYVQGTYKNVTLVYNKGTLKGYINGVLIGTKSGLVLTDTQYIPIGYTSEHIGIGDVRLFKVHDKELTQAEITANFNSYVSKGLLS